MNITDMIDMVADLECKVVAMEEAAETVVKTHRQEVEELQNQVTDLKVEVAGLEVEVSLLARDLENQAWEY